MTWHPKLHKSDTRKCHHSLEDTSAVHLSCAVMADLLIDTSTKRASLASFFPTDILGSLVSPCKSAKNLGVLFDSSFTFSSHISSVCRACFINIRVFCRVRCYLSLKAATMLANALVSSKIDYSNSLLASFFCKGYASSANHAKNFCAELSVDCHGEATFLKRLNHYTGSPFNPA